MKILIFLYLTLGFIFGIIISYILIKKQKVYRAPSSSEIKRKIFVDENGVKVRLIPRIHICPIIESMKK